MKKKFSFFITFLFTLIMIASSVGFLSEALCFFYIEKSFNSNKLLLSIGGMLIYIIFFLFSMGEEMIKQNEK